MKLINAIPENYTILYLDYIYLHNLESEDIEIQRKNSKIFAVVKDENGKWFYMDFEGKKYIPKKEDEGFFNFFVGSCTSVKSNFSSLGREVSAADHVELKAFSASFSKLDAEAIYRLLPFSKGNGYGYLDQKTRKIIVQPCATELIIPKRKSGKQLLGSIPNKNDDFHYFEVSWERDKGLIFTKKHQQISAPPSGISVKKLHLMSK